MPATFEDVKVCSQLRDKAEAQLQTGTTKPTGQWTMGVDALSLLHRLSTNPDSAQDALKLLHELQVHQVELDLQNEEMADNEQALAADLNRYRTLFDYAPIAYCVVDFDGIITQSNLAFAESVAAGQQHLPGQRLDSLVAQQSRLQLLGLLKRVAKNGVPVEWEAEMSGSQGTRNVQFRVSLAPQSEHLMLVCYECAHAK